MKKLLFFLILVAISHTSGLAQGCLPQGITFTTQAQVDSFPINYPGCAYIEGDVTIWGTWDITNLTALSSLTSVGGNFTINDSHALDDFTGLDNLQSIAGNVLIKNNIYQVSFAGLQNLTTIGGNFDTYQYYNTTLTNFEGLNSLTTIGGNFSVTIYGVLNNFSGLDNLKSIGGNFQVAYTTIQDFSGLDSLTSIGGVLSISGNSNLVNFNGLQNLSTVGSNLDVNGNPRLTSFAGLNNLILLNGTIDIAGNDSLVSLNGIDNINASTISHLFVFSNHQLSTCEVKSVCDYIAGSNISTYVTDNAPGCNTLQEVGEACHLGVEINPAIGLSIYPNPSNSLFTINLSLKDQSLVKLIVLNSLGQEVETLIDEQLMPGEQYLTWEAEGFPAGVYYYMLQAGNQSGTGKMIVLK